MHWLAPSLYCTVMLFLPSLKRYLTSLRREKEAFHQLIKEKGVSSCVCIVKANNTTCFSMVCIGFGTLMLDGLEPGIKATLISRYPQIHESIQQLNICTLRLQAMFNGYIEES